MPRSVDDILKHGDELAQRFEDYEPNAADECDPAAVDDLRRAVTARSDAERSIRDAVDRGPPSQPLVGADRIPDRHLGRGRAPALRQGPQDGALVTCGGRSGSSLSGR